MRCSAWFLALAGWILSFVPSVNSAGAGEIFAERFDGGLAGWNQVYPHFSVNGVLRGDGMDRGAMLRDAPGITELRFSFFRQENDNDDRIGDTAEVGILAGPLIDDGYHTLAGPRVEFYADARRRQPDEPIPSRFSVHSGFGEPTFEWDVTGLGDGWHDGLIRLEPNNTVRFGHKSPSDNDFMLSPAIPLPGGFQGNYVGVSAYRLPDIYAANPTYGSAALDNIVALNSCEDILDGALSIPYVDLYQFRHYINQSFTPNGGLTIRQAADACGVDHFNYLQWVKEPTPWEVELNGQVVKSAGMPFSGPGLYDPVIGPDSEKKLRDPRVSTDQFEVRYVRPPDLSPMYFNEWIFPPESASEIDMNFPPEGKIGHFSDGPSVPSEKFKYEPGEPGQLGEYTEFVTEFVGVDDDGRIVPLPAVPNKRFRWGSNQTSAAGTQFLLAYESTPIGTPNLPAADAGGVFLIDVAIPEPSSVVLAMIGVFSIWLAAVRRRVPLLARAAVRSTRR